MEVGGVLGMALILISDILIIGTRSFLSDVGREVLEPYAMLVDCVCGSFDLHQLFR